VTKVFLDTNILVYAVDRRDSAKHGRAIKAVEKHIRAGSGVLSTQVLQEFASVALGKLHQRPEVVLAELSALEAMEVAQVTPALIRRALELHVLYQVNYWDAAILAAAEASRCTRLWSEDFGVGSIHGLVQIENPLADRE
jgi:predicted nucleic acid-binding protein